MLRLDNSIGIELDKLLIDKLVLIEMTILINLGFFLSGYDGASKKLDLLSIFTPFSSKRTLHILNYQIYI